MNTIYAWAKTIAIASDNHPLIAAFVVFLLYIGFSYIESQIESVIFGESFFHPLDVIFSLLFFAFYLNVLHQCMVNKLQVL